MKTSDEFSGHTPVTRDIPDYRYDPYTVVCAREAALVSEYHFNLQGVPVMTDTINPVIPTEVAAKVHTRYTDPLDIIEDKITDTGLKARVLSSLAWMLDNQCIVTARMFFFEQYRESEYAGQQDGLNEFMANFRGSLDIEAVFGSGGPATELVNMLSLRQEWHDAAGSAMDADGRVYDPRSWDMLIASERVAPVSSLTKAKQQQLAKFAADGNADDEAEFMKMFEARSKNRAEQRAEMNRMVGPAVLELIHTAERYRQPTQFEHLDKRTRERFFRTGVKFLMNAMSDMAERNSISDFEFAMMMKEFKEAKRCLEFVLSTDFKEDPVRESIVQNAGRASKAAAAASDASDFEADVAAREQARQNAQAAADAGVPI